MSRAEGLHTDELHIDRPLTTKFISPSPATVFATHLRYTPGCRQSIYHRLWQPDRPPVYTPRRLGEALGVYAVSSTAGSPFIRKLPSHRKTYSSSSHPILRPYDNSVAPAGFHLTSAINSAMHSLVKSTGDPCQIFNVTIWWRSLTI